MSDQQELRLLLAARLSKKAGKADKYQQGIGIETQDKLGREWAERQRNFTTVHGTYSTVKVIDTAADYKTGRVAPWKRKNLRPWVTRPEMMARYDGILAYKNDRLSRGAWDDETEIRQWASKHGKVLVIVDGPQWPPRHDGDFWQWTAQAQQAAKEWEEIRERNMRSQKELREKGKLVGRCPWGYEPFGELYNKTIMPTGQCREFAPQVFQRKVDGDSLMDIARWLDTTDAEPKYGGSWSPKSVANMIRNRTYMGQHQDENGRLLIAVEAVVDAKLWQQANDALTNSPVGRRGPTSGKTALLTGCLFCPVCPKDGKHAPMYRVNSRGRGFYYRCAGHLPQRRGCGSMIKLDTLDQAVIDRLSRAPDKWTVMQLIPGENYDIEIAEVRLALDDLGKLHLSDDEEDAERKRLRKERDRLEEANKHKRPDEWKPIDTDRTVGQEFARRDFDGRREMLLENVKVFAAYADIAAVGIEDVLAIRIVSRLFKVPLTWNAAA
jgi:DNA invertase Pin-like site-specific DNA recombinase